MLDLASALEGVLKSLNANTITNIFIFLIVILFITSLVLSTQSKGKKFTSNTAGLLTSFGILGTFIGIVIGLLEFDPKNIDESIQLLLEGLKTAFITSLVGMSAAITYKVIETTPLIGSKKNTSEKTSASPKDILNAILNQNHSLKELKDTLEYDRKLNISNQEKQILLMVHQNKNLIALKESLTSEKEDSLIGGIKSFRQDVNYHYKEQKIYFNTFSEKLWIKLREFSEILSKSATEQVIEALKGVISSFNENLTEQFGENFKALDSSVKKLVDWQTKYGEQLEQMISLYDKSVQAITEMEKAMTSINKETQAIPESMEKLQSVIEVNQNKIHEHANTTIQSIALTAKEASAGYKHLLSETDNLQKGFELSTTQLLKKQADTMSHSMELLEDEIRRVITLTGVNVDTQLSRIDESITREVNRVMTEMGQALASISGQFTQDYQKLTKKMKKITSMAEV